MMNNRKIILLLMIVACQFSALAQDQKVKINADFLQALNRKDFTAAIKLMEPSLFTKNKSAAVKLEKKWNKFQANYGKITSTDSTYSLNEYPMLVDSYVKMENGTALLVSIFNSEGKIIGIHAMQKKKLK